MRQTVAALLALGLSLPAIAHDDATLDAMDSPHGGQMRMAGPYHYELVLGDNAVRVYLTDHADQPVSSEGVSGNAIILSGSRATIALTPSGDNRLEGQGEFQIGPEMRAVVSLRFPNGSTWQARFTPWERLQAQQGAASTPPSTHDPAHPH